jgi:hypothetical protein
MVISRNSNMNTLLVWLLLQTISSEMILEKNQIYERDYRTNDDLSRTLVGTVQSNASTNVSLPKNFNCANITYPGLAKPFEVCFTGTSSWNGAQDNTQYFHQNNYTIFDRKNHSKTLFKIGVSKKSDVATNGKLLSSAEWIQVFDIGQCKTKRYCGDDKYTADCTNILFGRLATCEPLQPVFFPFTEEAIMSGTKKPATPSFRPTQSPTSKLTSTLTPTEPPSARPIIASASKTAPSTIVTLFPSSVPTDAVPAISKSPTASVPATISPMKSPSLRPTFTTTLPTTAMPNLAPAMYPTSDTQRPSSTPVTSAPFPTSNIPTSSPISCINYTYPGMIGNPFEVCYEDKISYVDGVTTKLRNGTRAAVPCFKHTYNIYNRDDMITPSFTIILKRTGNHVPNEVDTSKFHVAKVAGIAKCKWSHYCGNNTFTADCTNLLYGRRAQCEPIKPFFFPFTADAVRTAGRTPIVKLPKPTRVPVPKPIRAPVPAPTTSYTTISNGTALQCTNVTYTALANPFKVCYKTKHAIRRSVKYLWNRIQPYVIERHEYNHTIYNHNTTTVIGMIGVGQSTKTYPNGTTSILSVYVKVVGVALCNSYSSCGQDKISADCTNLQYGRKVTCESILHVFYPFTNEATTQNGKIKRILK